MTTPRQQAVLSLLEGEWVPSDDGTRTSRTDHMLGLTWRELADALGVHHGVASGLLSGLHRRGLIERLGPTHRRLRCSAYVLPEHVNGRDTVPYGRQRTLTDDPAYQQEVTRRVQAEGRITRALDLLDRYSNEAGHTSFTNTLRKVLLSHE